MSGRVASRLAGVPGAVANRIGEGIRQFATTRPSALSNRSMAWLDCECGRVIEPVVAQLQANALDLYCAMLHHGMRLLAKKPGLVAPL